MLYYDKIDVSEGTGVNKRIASKKVIFLTIAIKL